MNNPVDQPKVSDLDANAVMDALDAWHLDKRRTYASTPKSGMEAAIRAYLAALPQPHVGDSDLRTLVPGFRLDWSGLRARFEEDALRIEKLTTYESRAAHLDEMARQFEDAVTSALSALIGIPGAEKGASPEPTEGDGKMQKVSEVIKYFTDVLERFGDSCVYVRRGGVAWGAVALNRRDDDKAHGIFDLQTQHDHDMGERLAQIERLIANRDEWRDRAWKAEAPSRALKATP